MRKNCLYLSAIGYEMTAREVLTCLGKFVNKIHFWANYDNFIPGRFPQKLLTKEYRRMYKCCAVPSPS
jgi:hypothetical protein